MERRQLLQTVRIAANRRVAALPDLAARVRDLLEPRPRAGAARNWWLPAALVVLLFAVPLFVGLGNSDVENDEAIYSFAVNTMLHNGDWLTPRSIPDADLAFLEKPPLKFWIVALPIRLGLLPENEFGLRFWDALFGGALFLYVLATGRRLGGPLCGLAAVLILFTHRPILFSHGVRNHEMESALMLCYAGAMYHFLAWRIWSPGRRRRHVAGVAAFFVLGFMTKFVAALFLPIVFAAALLPSRDGQAQLWRDRRGWLAAILGVLVVTVPWFVYQRVHSGPEFWSIIFGTHVWTRFTGTLDPSHLKPWSYYATEIFHELGRQQVQAITAIGLALLALRVAWTRAIDAAAILLWFVVPIALMSLLTSKVYHYTYPFLAPAALAGGYGVAVLLEASWRAIAVVRARLAGAASGRIVSVAATVVALLAVFWLLPLREYRDEWPLLREDVHPLRTLRGCLKTVMARQGESGVYVEDEVLTHPYYYYLGDMGGWVVRTYLPQDATIYRALFVPPMQQPVVLSRGRFKSFFDQVAAHEPELLQRAAQKAGRDPATLRPGHAGDSVAAVTMPGSVILLPGPFDSCGTSEISGSAR